MTVIILSGMRGMIPRLSSRKLPDLNAQSATNVKISSGEATPYRKSELIKVPYNGTPPLSMYHAIHGVLSEWFTWPFDVDVVAFPTEGEPRFGWTGDGEPRWAPYSLAVSGGGNDYPHAFYALGIPNPVTAPTVVPSATGVGTTISRSYCYTYFSQHGEESGPSAASEAVSGKVDDTWAISAMDAFPPNSYAVTAAAWAAGVLTLTCANVFGLRAGDRVTNSGFAPAALNGDFTVASVAAPGFTISMANPGTITDGVGTSSRVAPWNTTGMKRRLYRTSGTAATFQLVADDVGVTFNDTVLDANMLGDDLISQGWQPPPATLTGLMLTTFGSLFGFYDKTFYLSEPFQPHAWKDGFTGTTDYKIVAAAVSGADIVVATQANPYVIVGLSPDAVSAQKIDAPYPCLSKRSIISDGSGAMYASKHGVVYVLGGAAKVMTEQYYTIDEWLPLNPETMFFGLAHGRLFIGHTNNSGVQKAIVLSTENEPVVLDTGGYSFYSDPFGVFYVGTSQGIEELDPQGGVPLPMEWWSKRFILPTPANLGAAKVDFDPAIDPAIQAAQQATRDASLALNVATYSSGELNGAWGMTGFAELVYCGDDLVDVPDVPPSNTVTFTLYRNGSPEYSRVVSDTKGFRLPAGFKTDDVSVKINGQCPIFRVILADTMNNLKQV